MFYKSNQISLAAKIGENSSALYERTHMRSEESLAIMKIVGGCRLVMDFVGHARTILGNPHREIRTITFHSIELFCGNHFACIFHLYRMGWGDTLLQWKMKLETPEKRRKNAPL